MKKAIYFLFFSFLCDASGIYSQNVGIGTSTPTEKLHVAGNIKADTVKSLAFTLTTNAGSGKILTSDAAGNASWQTGNASGSVGLGSWADCSFGFISEYNPVADVAPGLGDNFGNSVSVSGNYAIVGANLDDGPLGADQGSVCIYQHNGTHWVFLQKLTDATGAAGDQFGYAVSISGNYAIVGAYADDNGGIGNQGSASIYQLSGGTWVLMNKIIDGAGAQDDLFGYSVSISGTYAIVGSPSDNETAGADQGSAIIYQLTGGNWVLMNKITDPAAAVGDFFGFSVSISGTYVIAGAILDDEAVGNNQGSATIYRLIGAVWTHMNKITDNGAAIDDSFGWSVSVSGNLVIVGAPGVYSDIGSASIFQYNGSNWVFVQKLMNTAASNGDLFGVHVSISGNYAIVGTFHDNVSGIGFQAGSATIFRNLGPVWERLQYLTDPSGEVGETFGISTAIDDTNRRFLIGANNYTGNSGKAVFGRIN